jgi:uncharacterized membrane-anchored protein YitT (DUF2179 family)
LYAKSLKIGDLLLVVSFLVVRVGIVFIVILSPLIYYSFVGRIVVMNIIDNKFLVVSGVVN